MKLAYLLALAEKYNVKLKTIWPRIERMMAEMEGVLTDLGVPTTFNGPPDVAAVDKLVACGVGREDAERAVAQCSAADAAV